MVNSREKGKVGEREAVHFLKKLGFTDAFRAAQANGKYAGDVVIPEVGLHIEVKFGYPADKFSIGSALWSAATEQASADSRGLPWVLLWKPYRSRRWRATALLEEMFVTVDEDCVYRLIDRVLNEHLRSEAP